jgi:hypothetical protein
VVVDLPQVEDLPDVAVRQLHRDARLVDEHLDEVRILAVARMQALDGQDLLEPTQARGLGRKISAIPPMAMRSRRM